MLAEGALFWHFDPVACMTKTACGIVHQNSKV
jgi:hypothetical protein